MCGLAGIVNIRGEQVTKDQVEKMASMVSHRGPDGGDCYIHTNFGVGHKRLSILDTSSNGTQPMISRDKNWVVAFNGCIFNFRELKLELLSKGIGFNSTTDTEVIVEGLCVYGVDYFRRFNGMFAIAAFHVPSRTLYLSRDRYGIKPLYFAVVGSKFLFASEIKAFLAIPEFQVQINLPALNEYFTFQNIFSYQTLFKGVEMLPPANTVKIDTQDFHSIRHVSWWDYDFSESNDDITLDEAQEETEHLFKQAIKRQLVSDVPVGSYLSGGMDSGSITAVAASQIPRLTTFTAGFDMSSVTGVEANYDERRGAELMASLFGTEHYEQVINAGDLAWSLPRVVWHIEDLRVGMSYPNYYISRLASKFVKVCLQGTGGDELFGGYPWRYYRVFQSLDQGSFFKNYYGFWQRLVNDEEKVALFQKDVLSVIDVSAPKMSFERVFTFNEKLKYARPEDHINNSLYFEIKTFLPGLLLVGDKLSMANGLEERFPFLDNDLVDFAQKIPVKYKLGDFEEKKRLNENLWNKKSYREFDDGKNVLRKAMKSILPQEVVNRKKQGFSAPDESWYRGENAVYVKDLLLNRDAAYTDYIRRDYVEKIISEHMDHRINHRLLLWSLMNFEWWCKLFLRKESYAV